MIQGEGERVVTSVIEEAWNRGQMDVLDRQVAPDYRRRGSTVIDGREAWTEWILAVRSAFPDFHVEIHQVIRCDDWAATRFTASATHTSPYLGFEPTGARFSADGMVIVRMEGGLITEEWEVTDRQAVFEQLRAASQATDVSRDEERSDRRLDG